MSKIVTGDVFELQLADGSYIYLHFLGKDEKMGDLIEVFCQKLKSFPENFCEEKDRYDSFFVFYRIRAALRMKAIQKIGHCEAIKTKPRYMRSTGIIDIKQWLIIDTETWEWEVVDELSETQRKLSPWGIWNSALIRERMEKNWKLETWV